MTQDRDYATVTAADVMRAAWATYYPNGRNTAHAFNRVLFAFHLRAAWAATKGVSPAEMVEADRRVAIKSTDPIVRRIAQIEDELRGMEFQNFTDWDRRRALQAEISRLRSQQAEDSGHRTAPNAEFPGFKGRGRADDTNRRVATGYHRQSIQAAE